jgi:hypothetical protein
MVLPGEGRELLGRAARWWWPLAPALLFAAWQISVGRSYRATSLLALVLVWMIASSFAIWPRVRWLVPGVVPLLVAAAFGVVTTGWDLELATRLARATSLAGTVVLVLLAFGIPPHRVIEPIVHAVAVALRGVAAGLVYAIFILPAWAWNRLRRRNPVRLDEAGAPAWTPTTTGRDPDEPVTGPLVPHRRTLPGRLAWAVGCVVLIVALNYGIGWAWDEAFPTTPAAEASASTAPGAATTTPSTSIPAAAPTDGRTTTTLQPLPHDPRADLPAMAAYPWREQYFDEIRRTPSSYWPFTESRPLDFDGTFVHQDGWVRRSYEPKGDPDEMPTVWMFGGSTTWGEGQRDEYTIASWIARLSEEAGTPVRVRNYGQRGWVHFQEIVLYEQELALGKPPEIALFYDGANEINAQSLVDEAVPVHTYAYNMAQKLGSMTVATRAVDATPQTGGTDEDLWPQLRTWYQEHSAVDKIVNFFQGRADATAAQAPEPPTTTTTSQPGGGFTPQELDDQGNITKYPTTEQDGTDAGRVYRRWKPVTYALSRKYGVKPFLFWQPIRLDGTPQQAARAEMGSSTIDIHDALEDHPEVYIDNGHTNEEGARIVAERIWETMRPAVEQWHEQHD